MLESMVFIGVGVNPVSAKEVARAGARLLVSGAYIFNSSDIEKAIKELEI